jgi:nucleoside-diphosphate-sugar epimerase
VAAYGLDFDQPQSESSPITTLSGYPYCDAKAASEHPVLAAHAAGEIAATIIRPGDVYGPGSRPWVLIPLQLLRRYQFVLPASGQGIFSPVYIDNLLDGILAAIQEPRAQGQIFNITDGTDIPCAEFFGYHQRWLGRSGSPPCLPTPAARHLAALTAFVQTRVLRQASEVSLASLAMLARRSGYRIDKARRMLGYVPAIDLEQGMRLTGQALALS